MAIPDTPIFNDYLSSLTFTEQIDEATYEKIEIFSTEISDCHEHLIKSPLFIWRKRAGNLSTDSFITKICNELKIKDHFSSPELAKLIMAISLRVKKDLSPVERLNFLMSLIGKVDCSQFLISTYPPHPESNIFQLGDFTIGKINREKVVYRCKKVDCDYFDRYPNHFQNKEAIEREIISIRALDFGPLKPYVCNDNVYIELADNYFSLLSLYLRELFYSEFEAIQHIYIAAGAPSIILDNNIFWLNASFICIFQNFHRSGKGYFHPFGGYIKVDYAQADIRIPNKVKELKDLFNFTGFIGGEFHSSLRSYSKFVAKAKVHKIHNRNDEAFLHYVIALDLLLGGAESSTQNITKRASVITSEGSIDTYNQNIKTLKDLYNKRSKYVHEGKPITENDIFTIEPIVDSVLFCLLRLLNLYGQKDKTSVGAWLKSLDYIASAFDSGRILEEKEYYENGILNK